MPHVKEARISSDIVSKPGDKIKHFRRMLIAAATRGLRHVVSHGLIACPGTGKPPRTGKRLRPGVVDRTWQNQTAAPTVKDRYTCGYTRASNRLYRTNGVAANHAFE